MLTFRFKFCVQLIGLQFMKERKRSCHMGRLTRLYGPLPSRIKTESESPPRRPTSPHPPAHPPPSAKKMRLTLTLTLTAPSGTVLLDAERSYGHGVRGTVLAEPVEPVGCTTSRTAEAVGCTTFPEQQRPLVAPPAGPPPRFFLLPQPLPVGLLPPGCKGHPGHHNQKSSQRKDEPATTQEPSTLTPRQPSFGPPMSLVLDSWYCWFCGYANENDFRVCFYETCACTRRWVPLDPP